MVSDTLIFGGLAAISLLGIVEEVTSLGLPGWMDSIFELPFDLAIIAVGLYGVMS